MRPKFVLSSIVVVLVLLLLLLMFLNIGRPQGVKANLPPDVVELNGVVRDFRSTHPDFHLSSSVGHCVENVGATINDRRRPAYTGSGQSVTDQWRDKNTNPIRPYIGGDDPGLPGGHFDVDVFDELSDKEIYHEHQYDDKFDVTYVDLVNDSRLLLEEVLGTSHPTPLRIEFMNPHHGSGTYTFQAGGPVLTGSTKDGFTQIFTLQQLQQFRIDMTSLWDLRGTKPGTVQDDMVDRDDALSLRIFDVPTGVLVYELAVYHHTNGDEEPPDGGGGSITGKDNCGEDIDDTIGRYDGNCNGAVDAEASFNQWFNDVLGTNLSKTHAISLYRDANGIYEHLTDTFFPIDDQLFGNEGHAHNVGFTYVISATFVYDKCAGQFFEFQGNDDAWVFINGDLVIDLGGTGPPERQYIALDRLDLEDGQTYPLEFFYAHRRNVHDSVFRMRTNLLLMTERGIPTTKAYD